MGPTWGPSRADRTHLGPMLAPWTLLSGYISKHYTIYADLCQAHVSRVGTNNYIPQTLRYLLLHDDVIKWKHFQRHWPFVRGIHQSWGISSFKGQWLGALMFSLTCTCTNGWVNNRDAGDFRRHRAHYDVTLMAHKSISINHLFAPSSRY